MFPRLCNTIPVYPLMWGVAAGVAVAVGSWHAARTEKLPPWRCAAALVLLAASVLIGSKLLYLLEARFYPFDDYVPRAARGLLHGFRIPGGILLLAVAMPVLCRFLQLPCRRFGDAVIPLAALALVFIRLGCFLNGCCFGKVSTLPWAVSFPRGSLAYAHQRAADWIGAEASHSLPVHPLQLYFLASAAITFIVLLRQRHRDTDPGHLQLVFYSLFFASTAGLEPLRENYLTINNWLTPTAALAAAANGNTFHDKPWLTVDKVTGSPHLGYVYVSWTRFTCSPRSTILRLAVSANQGTTFSAIDIPGSGNGQGTSLAVGLDAKLNVIWFNGTDISFNQCEVTTGTSMTCGTTSAAAPFITPLPGTLPNLPGTRVFSWPALAIDNADGGNGYLYAVWADYRAGNGDIYFTRSTNNGQSWLTARPIAAAATDEFFPSVSVDQNHFVHVIFYQRTSQTTNTFNAYEISSGDAGNSFSAPVQLNDGGNIHPSGGFVPPDTHFFGDYIGIDTDYVRHPIWTDSRRGQDDIYTATVSGC